MVNMLNDGKRLRCRPPTTEKKYDTRNQTEEAEASSNTENEKLRRARIQGGVRRFTAAVALSRASSLAENSPPLSRLLSITAALHDRRQLLFADNGNNLRQIENRRRGRPRTEWGREVRAHAIRIAGDDVELIKMMSSKRDWRSRVREYCRTDNS